MTPTTVGTRGADRRRFGKAAAGALLVTALGTGIGVRQFAPHAPALAGAALAQGQAASVAQAAGA